MFAYMPYSAFGYLSVYVCVRLRQKKTKADQYIEYDGIGYGITDDLVGEGIPENNIVFSFLKSGN